MLHIGDDAELYAIGALDDIGVKRVENHIDGCPGCAARVNDALLAAAALAEALPATQPSLELGRRIRDSQRPSERMETAQRQTPQVTESPQTPIRRSTTSASAASSAQTPEESGVRTPIRRSTAQSNAGNPALLDFGSSFSTRSRRRESAAAARRSTGSEASSDFGNWMSARVVRYAIAAALVLALLDAGWQSFRFHRQVAVDDAALSILVHSHFNHVSMTPLASGALAAKILYARDGSWIYVIADRPSGRLQVFGYGAVNNATAAGKAAIAGFGTTSTGSKNAHPTEQGFGTSATGGAGITAAKTAAGDTTASGTKTASETTNPVATIAVNLGTMSSSGRTAVLMIHPKLRIRRVVLERGDAPVAEATLAY
jgi:hypothetical protein